MSTPIDIDSYAARSLHVRLTSHVSEGELRLPLLSASATQVLEACATEPDDALRLAEIIQCDPALTANVLRMANSAAFAPQEPIVSLQQAVSRLGSTTVSGIAVMVVLEGEIFQLEGQDEYLAQLWRHSTAAGCWAREIARLRRCSTEGAFLCALLHDVGKPVVLQALDSLAAWSLCEGPPSLIESWLDEFHGAVGGRMLKEWGMPPWMGDVVAAHHEPELLDHHQDEAHTVRLADLLADWSMAEEAEAELLEQELRQDPCVHFLGLYPDEVDGLLSAKERVRTLSKSFGLMSDSSVDVLIIGGGPAGHHAALTAGRAGASALLVERGRQVGGECVFRGTIPSKTLRETAGAMRRMRRGALGTALPQLGPKTLVDSLMGALDGSLQGHAESIRAELEGAGVTLAHARASLLGEGRVELCSVDGSRRVVQARQIVIATGTRPRTPPELPLDHESVLDSDSILSMLYLPGTLTVVGAGVIAAEFASVFQAVGVEVTMLDKYARPLGFLDAELSLRFAEAFERDGGRFLPERRIESMTLGAGGGVETRLAGGELLKSDKVLVAQGRVACLANLGLENVGLEANARGLIDTDEVGRTSVEGLYAVGDVTGPPALATAAMHEGRRAVRHALGLELGCSSEFLPTGIYTLPELASIGLTEEQARERFGQVIVGRAEFSALARPRIEGCTEGLLKLVYDGSGQRLLGAHIVSEQATEQIAVGQLALVAGQGPEVFVDNLFNFPTYGQAWRAAALEVIEARERLVIDRAA